MINKIHPEIHTIAFDSKIQLARSVWELSFHAQYRDEFNFTPGQYLAFIIDAKIRRQYSFASAPTPDGRFKIILDTRPNGIGTKFLMNLEFGDFVKVLSPLGDFVLPESLSSNLVFIATGTGIAPIKSMIEALQNMRKIPNIKIWFGTRYKKDIFYNNELSKLANYHICLSREKTELCEYGHVTQYVKNCDFIDTQFFLCGSGEMIESVKQILLNRSVNESNIFHEKFY